MKRILFITFCLFYLSLSSQELRTQFISKEPLEADTFVGIDEFQSMYYIQDNILFKKTSKQIFSYSNVDSGNLVVSIFRIHLN